MQYWVSTWRIWAQEGSGMSPWACSTDPSKLTAHFLKDQGPQLLPHQLSLMLLSQGVGPLRCLPLPLPLPLGFSGAFLAPFLPSAAGAGGGGGKGGFRMTLEPASVSSGKSGYSPADHIYHNFSMLPLMTSVGSAMRNGRTTPERARLSSSWRWRLKVRMVWARSLACRPLSLAWMRMMASSSGRGASSGRGPGSASPLTVYLSASAAKNLLRSSSS
ncbi:MAG: hypothetical protein FRX49_05222 [Trebouxia sp. A1-2]|nr:MAG: hypothetical protein FRX49_05222 [Trebouxia sp. A1-2]